MGRVWLLSLAILAAVARAAVATPAADNGPVRLATSVEPKAASIGTPLRYTLRVEANKDTELVVPELAGQIGDFQITDFGSAPPREEQGRVVLERWYTLVTYSAGDAIIPGPTVQYRVPGGELQNLAAPDALVTVESLLDAPDAQRSDDVRDIKPPVAVPRDYTPLLWIAAAGLAVLGLGVLLYRLLRGRHRPAVVVPPRPAHEIALEALARLRAAHLIEDGLAGEFYVRLSGIVRGYLEGRFHLRAPEMTTEEFLQAAQRDPQLNPGQRGLLGQFLSEADLVKFARHVPAAQDAERAYGAARQFVESTAPAMEAPRAVA